MADQGKWFKLHVDWDDDPHIDSLSLEDQVRWVKFGTYTKKHGTEGKIVLIDPCRTLQSKFRVNTFDEVISVLQKFPNYDVGEKQQTTNNLVTSVTVTIKNWLKYQADNSKYRTRDWRERVTGKKRGEEKRGDKKRREQITPLPQSEWFEKLWEEYPQKGRIKKTEALKRFAASVPDFETAKRCAAALDKYLDSKRVKEGYVQNAPTWFGDWTSWENYEEPTMATTKPGWQ